MAQIIITQLVDDISGEDLKDSKGETISFALDGSTYEIDLSSKNAEKLRGEFEIYISAGRKVGRTGSSRAKRTQTGASAKEIRDWARGNGFDVPDRGRVPGSVRAAFEAAS